MSDPTPQARAVAHHALKILKGTLKVQAFYDENRTTSVDILTTLDSVEKGLKSIGTIGLSEMPLMEPDGTESPTRVELCAIAVAKNTYWENVVASTAFHIKKKGVSVMPGDVIQNIINDYLPDPIMPHIYLTAPFTWNDAHFPELIFPPLKINWLQCISIYNSELRLIKKFGDDAFEQMLSEQEIDTLDPNRAPVIFR
jgi:hypothetical protein